MNKLTILIIGLVLLVGVFVSAGYFPDRDEESIIIYKGWNLIPYATEQLDDSSALQFKDAKYVYIYDINKGEYELIWKDGGWINQGGLEGNLWLMYSSVWAYFEEDGIITLDWGEYQNNLFSLDNLDMPWNLKSGWNFIFVVPDMAIGTIGDPSTARSLNDIKGDCTYEKIYSYKQDEIGWINLISNLDDKRMLGENSAQMYGLVIKVPSDCTLGTSSGGTSPPGLPSDGTTQGCIDTDGGVDYFTKGILTVTIDGQTASKEESCVIDKDSSPTSYVWEEVQDCSGDDCYIREGYCETFEESGDWWNEIICPNGCSEGACIQ